MSRRLLNCHRAVAILVALLGCACGKTGADVLAEVADKPVTKAQFGAYLKHRRLPAKEQSRIDHALDEYIEREALAEAVTQQGKLDAADVEAELNEFRKEMLISRYFEQFLADRVTDAAVRAYYDGHAGEYEERKIHVAHILVRTNKGMSAEERESRLTAARDAHAQILGGRDFAEVARERSDDRVSGGRGGDLGWIKQGGVDPKFSERVFAMKADEVSEPFETAFGFHVVKVLEGAQTVRRPFDTVAGDIRYHLRGEAKAAELKRLRDAVKVKRHHSFPAVAEPAASKPPAKT